MKKSVLFITALAAIVAAPAAALAQNPNFNYVTTWLKQGLYWLSLSITVLMIAMTLFFLFKIFQFISAKDATAQAEKKREVFNAMLGLFLSVAVWGIIRIAGNLVGVDVNNQTTTPAVTCPPGMRYSQMDGICTF